MSAPLGPRVAPLLGAEYTGPREWFTEMNVCIGATLPAGPLLDLLQAQSFARMSGLGCRCMSD